jgi:hypothetical protein
MIGFCLVKYDYSFNDGSFFKMENFFIFLRLLFMWLIFERKMEQLKTYP